MRAFINGCRNVVGLDGCHLKGKYGGCLLSATALDGQNGLVPLGIMICKNECAENWFLFLKHLKPRLDEHPVEGINFISDRQKGLREAVHKLFPTSPHRFCFRHMYKNFKSHFKGSKLHTMFWNAAKAYKAKHFQPLEGPDDWEEPRVIIVPPLLIRKQGRPRKNRRKAYDETLHEKKPRCCSKCKQPGHNKTTCGGGPIGSNSTKKRIRLEVDG
ncbi:MULE domain-containing protein [Heracleum sosnowskyi]|uniref:MULE domain-containing protein n=1 Tax=Heracleum sosnowskyi TaxID=360622 RepID=A0AAD8MGM2_9APIA|nr:MULE domain-containing protein [Heracleum sosnowskyi]